MTPKLPSPPTWNLFVGVVKIQKVMITPLTLPFAPSIVGRGSGCEKKAERLLPRCNLDDGEAKSNKDYVNDTLVFCGIFNSLPQFETLKPRHKTRGKYSTMLDSLFDAWIHPGARVENRVMGDVRSAAVLAACM